MRSVPAVRGVEYSGANTGGAAQVCYSVSAFPYWLRTCSHEFQCQQPGHFSNACPNKQGGGPGYDNGNRGDQVCYKVRSCSRARSSLIIRTITVPTTRSLRVVLSQSREYWRECSGWTQSILARLWTLRWRKQRQRQWRMLQCETTIVF